MGKTRQEFTSARTSINSGRLPNGFKNVRSLCGFIRGGINFDMGGGKYDNATEYLDGIGVLNLIFDPFNRDYNWNRAKLMAVSIFRGADTATCFNVLNVIKEPEERSAVIQRCAEVLKKGGTAYFEVYSDKEKYANGGSRQTGKDQWQEFRPLKTYVPEIEAFFGTVSVKGKTIIAREPKVSEKPAEWYYDANDDEPKKLYRYW